MIILFPPGEREAAINVAEGKKQGQILASEARKMEQINIATGIYYVSLIHSCDLKVNLQYKCSHNTAIQHNTSFWGKCVEAYIVTFLSIPEEPNSANF